MANISGVSGSMSLEGAWTSSMIKNLNTIREEWSKWYYSIDIDEFVETNCEVPFVANGCWRFDKNLDNVGVWTANSGNIDVQNAYTALCEEMNTFIDEDGMSEIKIDITFTEDEGGCHILRDGIAEIYYSREKGLTGLVNSVEDYEYTKENLVKLGIYDNVEEIDWLD